MSLGECADYSGFPARFLLRLGFAEVTLLP